MTGQTCGSDHRHILPPSSPRRGVPGSPPSSHALGLNEVRLPPGGSYVVSSTTSPAQLSGRVVKNTVDGIHLRDDEGITHHISRW